MKYLNGKIGKGEPRNGNFAGIFISFLSFFKGIDSSVIKEAL